MTPVTGTTLASFSFYCGYTMLYFNGTGVTEFGANNSESNFSPLAHVRLGSRFQVLSLLQAPHALFRQVESLMKTGK